MMVVCIKRRDKETEQGYNGNEQQRTSYEGGGGGRENMMRQACG